MEVHGRDAAIDQAGTFEFKAEVKQLLDILVHSLYTNKEIFLRELISNASDALERLRFETNRGTEITDGQLPLEIKITFDRDQKLLTISDTGVGMTREEIISDIGTIARSGSAEFLKTVVDGPGAMDNLIGRFGVGFYSVFMVAKEVILKTKSYKKDEPALSWQSDGLGVYQLTPLEAEMNRGTVIEIHLRDEAVEFADQNRLTGIIRKHSNFIPFPIFVQDERVNTVAAIWREPKFSITTDQYNEFYTFLTHDTDEPLTHLHVSVDAPVQFNCLLFTSKKSHDLPGYTPERPGLDLYGRRILIQKDNKDLIPEYLGFVRGVVDSDDLPLNISRETLQENKLVGKMAANITKQILAHLEKLAQDEPDKYVSFWQEHGRIFKRGYSDFLNREKFAGLLRFNSSAESEADGLVSFDQYIKRAKPGQKAIYFAAGINREAVSLNPHLEIFKAKGLEVLYLFDPFDEFALDSLRKYQEFDLKSVEQVDLSGLEQFAAVEEVEKSDPLSHEEEEEFKKFLGRIKDILGERVTDVKSSTRLASSPCCLVNPEDGLTSSMQKIMQIVTKDATIPKKIFEINKDHRLVRNLFKVYRLNPQDDYLTSSIEQLFESSLLLDGYVKDPHTLVNRLQNLLDKASGWYLAMNK